MNPLNRRIGSKGEVLARKPWAFDTFGIADSWTRVTKSIRHMSAGNMVYGLYRVEVLARAGVYRHVLVPDRLLMTELAIYGQFKQVPQVLWFRRWYGRIFSLGRQRANFFPGRRPLYQKLISSGQLKPGYACDNDAGIYFEDNEVKRVVHTRAEAKVYYVSVVDGKIMEKVMEPEMIS